MNFSAVVKALKVIREVLTFKQGYKKEDLQAKNEELTIHIHELNTNYLNELSEKIQLKEKLSNRNSSERKSSELFRTRAYYVTGILLLTLIFTVIVYNSGKKECKSVEYIKSEY